MSTSEASRPSKYADRVILCPSRKVSMSAESRPPKYSILIEYNCSSRKVSASVKTNKVYQYRVGKCLRSYSIPRPYNYRIYFFESENICVSYLVSGNNICLWSMFTASQVGQSICYWERRIIFLQNKDDKIGALAFLPLPSLYVNSVHKAENWMLVL